MRIKCCRDNNPTHLESRERQIEKWGLRKRDGEIERCVCVCVYSHLYCTSTPLVAFRVSSQLKWMHAFKECLWTWEGVSCRSSGGGGGGGISKTLKEERKPFFLFPFVYKCDSASFSALSHGHKDGSDNPFISLTSCRLREDRWLLPRLFMALLISFSQDWSLLPNPLPRTIQHLAECLNLSQLYLSIHSHFMISLGLISLNIDESPFFNRDTHVISVRVTKTVFLNVSASFSELFHEIWS